MNATQKKAIRLALVYLTDLAEDDRTASEAKMTVAVYQRAFLNRRKRCLELADELRTAFPHEARQHDAEEQL
jgi:hypothetical protein